jgi:L-rhamnose mutarotase
MAHLLSIRFDATACQYTGYGGIPKFGFRNIMAAAFTKLEEICENARMGREYALLGDYETAQIYYQSVLQQISQYTSTLKDTQQKQRWHKVSSSISTNERAYQSTCSFLGVAFSHWCDRSVRS